MDMPSDLSSLAPVLLRREDQAVRTLGASAFTFVVTRRETAGQMAITELHGCPGSGALPHIHRHEDELLYILSGEISCGIGERTVRAAMGAAIFLPRGVEHWFTVEVEARILIVFTPAGCEAFYYECSEAAPAVGTESATTTTGTLVDAARVMAIGAKYGIEFTGPWHA